MDICRKYGGRHRCTFIRTIFRGIVSLHMEASRNYISLVTVVLAIIFSTATSNAVSNRLLGDADTSTSCYSEGRFYPANSSFLTKDCGMQCICIGYNNTSCMDLCNPIPRGICPLGWKVVEEKEPAGPKGSNCFCTKKECVPAFCFTKDFVKYKIGESYQRNNCSETCTCTKETRFECRPTCPTINCPKGYRVKNTAKTMMISGCSCPVQRCKKPRRMCKANGRIYTNGKLFVTDNCRSKCKCKRNGVLRCSPLCPKAKTPSCGENERLVERKLPIALARGRCYCTRKICIPDRSALRPFNFLKPFRLRSCQFANRTLSPGQRFISKDCSDRCRCTSKGYLVCVPLCVNLPVTCLPDEERVLIRRPVRGGNNCSCTRVICRSKSSPAKRENECRVDGHAFQRGITYVDTNCSKACTCGNHGDAQCRPLCPWHQTTYCQNGYIQINQVRSAVAPWCKCYIKECITTEDNRTEIQEHRN